MRWAALSAFFAVALLSLAILSPRQHELGADSIQIIRGCAENGKLKSVSELRRSLTQRMQLSYAANWTDLGQMAILFESLAVCWR